MKPLSTLTDEDLGAELHRSRSLRDAPEATIERAINIFKPRAQRHQAPSLLERVLATLSFDSAGVLLPAHGLRGTATASRQVLFSAQGRDIDLRIVPVDGHSALDIGPWVIFGQVLGPDREGRVELSVGNELRAVALDEMLEFRFDQVPSGSIKLSLHLQGLVIDLPLEVPRPLST